MAEDDALITAERSTRERATATAWHAIRFVLGRTVSKGPCMKRWTDVVLWSVVLVSLLMWLLGVLGVLPEDGWINVLLVISAASAVVCSTSSRWARATACCTRWAMR